MGFLDWGNQFGATKHCSLLRRLLDSVDWCRLVLSQSPGNQVRQSVVPNFNTQGWWGILCCPCGKYAAIFTDRSSARAFARVRRNGRSSHTPRPQRDAWQQFQTRPAQGPHARAAAGRRANGAGLTRDEGPHGPAAGCAGPAETPDDGRQAGQVAKRPRVATTYESHDGGAVAGAGREAVRARPRPTPPPPGPRRSVVSAALLTLLASQGRRPLCIVRPEALLYR